MRECDLLPAICNKLSHEEGQRFRELYQLNEIENFARNF